MVCNCEPEMFTGAVCAWQGAEKASKGMMPSLTFMGRLYLGSTRDG
jgi:hypothetical protein